MMGLITGGMAGFVEIVNGLPQTTKVSQLFVDPIMQRSVAMKLSRASIALGVGSTLFQTNRCLVSRWPASDEVKVAVSLGVIAPLMLLRDFRLRAPWLLVLAGMDWFNGGLGGANKRRSE